MMDEDARSARKCNCPLRSPPQQADPEQPQELFVGQHGDRDAVFPDGTGVDEQMAPAHRPVQFRKGVDDRCQGRVRAGGHGPVGEVCG